MKKILLATLLCFLFVVSVQAQNTNVSATVTDSGAIAWANGTYTFTFIPSPRLQNGPYFNNGVPYTPVPISGVLSGSGAYTQAVPSNSTITPSGTTWTVTYCPQATASCQTSTPITISGASQTITSNFIPAALTVLPGANQSVYSTAEVGQASVGSQIYVIGTGLQTCSALTGSLCSTWASSSGGSGITQVASLPATCSPGAGYQLTSAPYTIYICGPANILTPQAPASGIVYAANYGAQGKLQVESNGANFGSASGTTTVNCSTCNFTTSTFHQLVVGDIYWATNWSGIDQGYTTAVATIGLNATAPCTVTGSITNTSFVGSCTASANSGTNNANTGVLAWGPDDQTANHNAKVAAYDGLNCQSLQLTGPFTNMDLPDFNTAACRGVSGGSTLSKYVGLIGQNPSGNTTILVPPWYGLGTSLATLCAFGTSGIACNGASGGMFNLTWNGLGQSSYALGGHNFIETSNDVSYQDVYCWGFAANSSGSIGFVFNQGLHIGINIIADGCGQTAWQTNGTVGHLFSVEAYNGTPSSGGLANVNLTGGVYTQCYSCVYGAAPSSGIAVNIGNNATYYGTGDFFTTPFLGGCWVSVGSGSLRALQGYCPNNAGGAAATSATNTGTGTFIIRDSQLGGGATHGAWNCGATALCQDGGGNTYTSVATAGASPVTTNQPIGAVVKTGQTANIGTTTIFTVGSSNTLFNAAASVACDSSSAAATVLVTILYTDVSGTAQTVASAVATCTALGAASTSSLNTTFMAKTATTIQYSTTIANTPTYDVRVALNQVGVN